MVKLPDTWTTCDGDPKLTVSTGEVLASALPPPTLTMPPLPDCIAASLVAKPSASTSSAPAPAEPTEPTLPLKVVVVLPLAFDTTSTPAVTATAPMASELTAATDTFAL